jgi:DNA-binding transcriptional MerR regulator
MDGPAQGETLTAREVAAALGVTERTVLVYVERGLLEAQTERRGLSRRHTFTASAVEACKTRLQQEIEG